MPPPAPLVGRGSTRIRKVVRQEGKRQKGKRQKGKEQEGKRGRHRNLRGGTASQRERAIGGGLISRKSGNKVICEAGLKVKEEGEFLTGEVECVDEGR